MRGNAICEVKGYRYAVLRRLLQVSQLDGRDVTAHEKESALASPSIVTAALVRAHCTMATNISINGANSAIADEHIWLRVEELTIEHGRLRKLHNVSRYVSVIESSCQY